MPDIRIMIVDDLPQMVDYFNMIITNEPGMTVAATASSGKEAIEKARITKPDIILMDIQMETESAGIESMKVIKTFLPETKFIMNTIHNDDEHIINSYSSGASDYITKSSPVSEIISTIRETYDDSMRILVTKTLANEISKIKTERHSMLFMVNMLLRLTPSELKVLKLIYSGKTYREIARLKCVEEATIRSFVNKILKKMEAKNMKSLIKELQSLNIMDLLEI